MSYYADLREHIHALDEKKKLVRIKREINKDTELMPLVRWQFRGLPEEERKAFLFENVFDSNGKKYPIPILVASHAASRDVYAIGMMCTSREIGMKWIQARRHPVEPVLVNYGPAQEVVHLGEQLLEHGGLLEFPVPVSTPGFDNAPYLTAANWITKDPETGVRNIGNYRAMVKSASRLGINCPLPQDLRIHWEKCREKGIPLQAAIAIGTVPAIGYVATVEFPYGVDEYAMAGGLAGEPISLVKCKTVDIEVPATAEIVIEGELPTDSMEREAPFGEFTGHIGSATVSPYFNVKCITHRRDPICNNFISEFPPSESSKLRHIGAEALLLKFLKEDLGLPVTQVVLFETCGADAYCVVSIKKKHPAQAWQVLNGVCAHTPRHKFVVVVDDDIDPLDPDSVNWAMSFRVQPHRDIRIEKGMLAPLDPSVAPPDELKTNYPFPSGASVALIDATAKWDYPPVSLPKKEFMERAKQIWEEEGLPKLNPKKPWFGYSMGYWTDEFAQEAELAVQGRYLETGEKLARERKQL